MNYDQCTESEVEAALDFIDASCDRDRWSIIGMAIKSEFGESGFSLFDTWSSGGDNYNVAATKATFKSIKSVGRTGSITIATLFKEAIAGGYKPDKKELSEQEKVKRADAARERQRQRAAEEVAAKRRAERWEVVYIDFFVRFQQEYLSKNGRSKYLIKKGVYPFGIGFLRCKVIVLVDLTLQSITAISGAQEISEFFSRDEYKDKDKFHFLYLKPGAVAVPMKNEQGDTCSFQIIFESGIKTFFKESRKKGLFHYFEKPAFAEAGSPAPSVSGAVPIVIAEGYATAASVHMATEWPCVTAFDAGNLTPVAEAIRRRYPERPIIICCDDDSKKKSTGQEMGARAAAAVGGVAILPVFTESNDTLC